MMAAIPFMGRGALVQYHIMVAIIAMLGEEGCKVLEGGGLQPAG